MSAAVAQQASVATLPVAEDVVYLSHSSSTMMEKCAAAYAYRYRDRLQSQAESMNLGFGKAFDQAVSGFLVGDVYGHDVDAVSVFTQTYAEWTSQCVVEISTRWKGQDAIIETGQLLVTRFVEWWRDSGFSVMLDPEGKPIIQRELRVRLPRNVIYTAILDLMVMTPEGQVAVVDVKTPSADCPEGFPITSGQLTGQQLVVEAHAGELGIDRVEKLGFLNAIKRPVPTTKRGEGPTIAPVHLVDARTPEQVEEYIQSRLWVADDIRRKRFAKRSLDAYNTPCTLCEFRQLCTTGSREGLIVRPPRKRRP